MTVPAGSAIAQLDRKISRAVQRGRGIRLEAHDLDLLATVGALAVLSEAATRELRILAEERVKARA